MVYHSIIVSHFGFKITSIMMGQKTFFLERYVRITYNQRHVKFMSNCGIAVFLISEAVEDMCITQCNFLHLSRSLLGRWDATDDLATRSLHSSRLSAFLMAAPSVMPVHSGMLSSHLFFCLLLPPCTVPCRIVLATPVTCRSCHVPVPFQFATM